MAGKPILNGRDSVRKVLQIFRERGGPSKQVTFLKEKFPKIKMLKDYVTQVG